MVAQGGGNSSEFTQERARSTFAILELGQTMSNIGDAKPDLPRMSPHRIGLRLILETALDAVVIMRSDGVVDDWNDRAAGIFGWSREEAVGRILADLIIPERYRKRHRYGLERYLAEQKSWPDAPRCLASEKMA